MNTAKTMKTNPQVPSQWLNGNGKRKKWIGARFE